MTNQTRRGFLRLSYGALLAAFCPSGGRAAMPLAFADCQGSNVCGDGGNTCSEGNPNICDGANTCTASNTCKTSDSNTCKTSNTCEITNECQATDANTCFQANTCTGTNRNTCNAGDANQCLVGTGGSNVCGVPAKVVGDEIIPEHGQNVCQPGHNANSCFVAGLNGKNTCHATNLCKEGGPANSCYAPSINSPGRPGCAPASANANK